MLMWTFVLERKLFRQVLIIGGGDGGVTRVLDAHPAVKEITLCEIDEVTPIEIVGGTFVENL